jgi:hypothetical protein
MDPLVNMLPVPTGNMFVNMLPDGLGMALNSAMRAMRPGSNLGPAERHLSSFIRAAR